MRVWTAAYLNNPIYRQKLEKQQSFEICLELNKQANKQKTCETSASSISYLPI